MFILYYLLNYRIVGDKVGFPSNALNKVINLLEDNHISYEVDGNVYDFKTRNKYKKILDLGKRKCSLDYRVNDIISKLNNLDEKDIVIGIVGRISEQKDPMTSIKAAAKIIKEKSNIYFMFVGTGELEKQVLNYAQNQKIEDHIIITGWVDNVKPYISTFDIALLPSKWEGFGLAIVEYMTCKKPIITTKLGGIADILNKEGAAFFIEKENENDIVKHIKYILNNEENIKIMVEDNYKHCAERFDIEREVKQHEILFEELLNKREK